MKRPPLVMRIKIRNEETKFGLWLPLFIIFPLVAVLFLVLAPLALLAALIVWPLGYARTVLCAPALYGVFCAMRGLEVDIKDTNENTVLIKVS